jgi:hypothetical protein
VQSCEHAVAGEEEVLAEGGRHDRWSERARPDHRDGHEGKVGEQVERQCARYQRTDHLGWECERQRDHTIEVCRDGERVSFEAREQWQAGSEAEGCASNAAWRCGKVLSPMRTRTQEWRTAILTSDA